MAILDNDGYTEPYNHWLSRTLRVRDNGAADCHPLAARREAPHNHADEPDFARPKLHFVRARRLSAAPLGLTTTTKQLTLTNQPNTPSNWRISMPTANILGIVVGVSTVLGLLGLVAYLGYTLTVARATTSVRSLIDGQALFDAKQIVDILGQYSDDNTRLRALELLTKYDEGRARELLRKIESKIDVSRLTQITSRHYRELALGAFLLFLALAVVVLIYSRRAEPTPRPLPVAWTEQFPLSGIPNQVECRCIERIGERGMDFKSADRVRYIVFKNNCSGYVELLASKDVAPPIGSLEASAPSAPGAFFRTTHGRHWMHVTLGPAQQFRFDFSGSVGGGLVAIACEA
ncbi:MAG: hypothetical protein LM513_03090 [Nitrospira sp.]|nr:hypothetical protein [Nitrospira sp.]